MKKLFAPAAVCLVFALSTAAVSAGTVFAGFDYFQTIQPTSFVPLGPLNPLTGLPIGPGATDTIVQRQANCAIDFNSAGSQCTIPIEMVALSLVSTVNPSVRVRESPTLASVGLMTLTSDGSGGAGTFDSFFDIFTELSLDNGTNWIPQQSEHLVSTQTPWYMNGAEFIVLLVTEVSLLATHTGNRVPEPGSLGLVGLALGVLRLTSFLRRPNLHNHVGRQTVEKIYICCLKNIRLTPVAAEKSIRTTTYRGDAWFGPIYAPWFRSRTRRVACFSLADEVRGTR